MELGVSGDFRLASGVTERDQATRQHRTRRPKVHPSLFCGEGTSLVFRDAYGLAVRRRLRLSAPLSWCLILSDDQIDVSTPHPYG
jgi:hypothetical protein